MKTYILYAGSRLILREETDDPTSIEANGNMGTIESFDTPEAADARINELGLTCSTD